MKEQHDCDILLDYFNSNLPETKRMAFKKHLETCSSCRDELIELQTLTENLPYTAEAIQPNDGMKDRILTAVFSNIHAKQGKEIENKKPAVKKHTFVQPKRWMQPLLAASLLLSLGANAYFFWNGQLNMTEPATANIIEDVQLEAAKEFNGSARATIVTEENAASLILQAEQLKILAGTEAYQVWLIDGSGNKVRAGTFRPNEDGNGAVSHTIPELESGKWQMIAVTLEPTPKSAQPLGEIVLASEL